MCLIVGYHAWSTFSFFKFIIKYHLDMSYGGMSITIVFFLINVIIFFSQDMLDTTYTLVTLSIPPIMTSKVQIFYKMYSLY